MSRTPFSINDILKLDEVNSESPTVPPPSFALAYWDFEKLKSQFSTPSMNFMEQRSQVYKLPFLSEDYRQKQQILWLHYWYNFHREFMTAVNRNNVKKLRGSLHTNVDPPQTVKSSLSLKDIGKMKDGVYERKNDTTTKSTGGFGGHREIPIISTENSTFESPLRELEKLTTSTLPAGYPLKLVIGVNEIPPKRRKSRTAFSVHQLTQLENRFRKQKYLTPSDRDQITKTLKLTSAQVITWFQNRRAKLKRDLEEMQNDLQYTRKLKKVDTSETSNETTAQKEET